MSPAIEDLHRAARHVIEAAVAWSERDYGDSNELAAAAALADAVIDLRTAAERAGLRPGDAIGDLLL